MKKLFFVTLLLLLSPAIARAQQPFTSVFGINFAPNNAATAPSTDNARMSYNSVLQEIVTRGAGQQIRDSATPLGVNLLSVTDNAAATIYFSAAAAGLNSAELTFLNGESAALSAPGTGRMIYNDNTQTFQISVDGGGFASLTTGGISFPIQNGTSTVTFNYGGPMIGSTLAYQFGSTNPYGVGDEAFSLNSAGAEFLKVVQTFSGIWDIQSDNNNIGLLSANGDGIRAQGANSVYIYGANATQVLFLANNGITPVAPAPLFLGSAASPWSYTGTNTVLTPLGGTLTSGTTITPTQTYHKVSGAATISTISAASLPTSFNGLLMLECTGAAVFATGGNILTGFTATANKTYLFAYDGTNWSVVGGG